MLLNDVHDSHLLQQLISALFSKQLIVLAKILAQVVLPTPLGPQNKYEWEIFSWIIAFFRVLVIDFWPTTSSKFWGLCFLADTKNFSTFTILYYF